MTRVAGDAGAPSLSVIVLNFRDVDATSRCMASVGASRYAGDLELVVLDNGSGDGSAARLEAAAAGRPLPTRIIASEINRGFAGGVNFAWPGARGELVCLLNNDAVLHPDCLATLAEALVARDELGAVWPFDAPIEWADGFRVPEAAQVAGLRNGTQGLLGASLWLPLLADYRECFTPSGVCLMLRRRDHERPFLDEYFAYHEDVHLGWRLRLAGQGCERVTEAVVYHSGSGTSRRQPDLRRVLAVHAEKNRLLNPLLLYSPGTLARLAPLALLDGGRRWAAAAGLALIGRPERVIVLTRARCWLVRHLRWVLAARRREQARRRVADAGVLPLMSARLTAAPGLAARALNAMALAYCRLAGIRTCETRLEA